MRFLVLMALFLFAPSIAAQVGLDQISNTFNSGPYRSYPLNYSGAVDPLGATMAITFDRAVAGTYETEVGGYTMTVNGSPTRVTDGTWPTGLGGAQGFGWDFDGAADYLSRTDDGTFDPAGDFSLIAVVTPDTVAAGEDCIFGKYETTGNEKGWKLCRDTATVVLTISVDGSADTTTTKTAALAAGRPACIVATYDMSATTGSIYVDELTAATNASMAASVNDSAAPFEMGASDTGATLWDGRKSHQAYYPGLWTEAQARKLCRQWRGMLAVDGSNYVTVTSASPPTIQVAPADSGTEPFLVDQPVNASQIVNLDGTRGGLQGAAGVSNLAQRASFETWVTGAPTGWTESNTPGAGAADWTEDTTNLSHLFSAANCELTAADSASTLTSACLTVTGATAHYVSAWAKELSGTGLFDINILEDDSTDCLSITTTTAVENDAAPTATWAKYGGAITTQAATIRMQVQLSLPAAAAQSVTFDAVQLRAASTPIDVFCSADTDATAVCTTLANSTNSPIVGNQTLQVEGTWSTPMAGTDLAASLTFFLNNAYGGPNTTYAVIHVTTNEPQFGVADNTGAGKYLLPNVSDWAADTDYAMKFHKDGQGNLGLWWNSAWQRTMAGAGTGLLGASQTTMYLCSGVDCLLRELTVSRRLSP